MENNQYTVNTSNCCFLCLKLVNSTSSDNECDGRGGKGGKLSLHNLLHYLKADLGEHLMGSKSGISTDILQILLAPDLRFTICEACTSLYDEFSQKLRNLEAAQMTLNYSLRSIYDQVRKADRGYFIMEVLRAQRLGGVGSSCQYDVVEGMRRKLQDECSRKLRRAEPRVRIRKLSSSLGPAKISKSKIGSKDTVKAQDSIPELLMDIGEVKVEQSYQDLSCPDAEDQHDFVKANDLQPVQNANQEPEKICVDANDNHFGLDITKIIVGDPDHDEDIPMEEDNDKNSPAKPSLIPDVSFGSQGNLHRRTWRVHGTLPNPVHINLITGRSWLIKRRRSFYLGPRNTAISRNLNHIKRPRPNGIDDPAVETPKKVNRANGNCSEQPILSQPQQQPNNLNRIGGVIRGHHNTIRTPPTPPKLPNLEEVPVQFPKSSLTRCGICRMIVTDLSTHLYYAHSRVDNGESLQHTTQVIPPPQNLRKPQGANFNITMDPSTRKLNCSCSPSNPFSNGGSFQCHYKTVDFNIRYQCANCGKDFLQNVTFTLRASTWVSENSYAMFAIKCFPVTLI